ncbi:MAG: hypothetical protein JWO31_1222, partial [Phycisphaerales bacterium]|nr:hypothetical protein [Phycisphaerales bacterium]
MRKDLRLGLGLGVLATVFTVTFLVVRNYTANQTLTAADDAAQLPDADAPSTDPVPPTPA